MKFFGYGTIPNGTLRRAFLSDGDEVYIVGEGDTLLGRFRIVKINNANLEFEEIATGRHNTVTLQEEQGRRHQPDGKFLQTAKVLNAPRAQSRGRLRADDGGVFHRLDAHRCHGCGPAHPAGRQTRKRKGNDLARTSICSRRQIVLPQDGALSDLHRRSDQA